MIPEVEVALRRAGAPTVKDLLEHSRTLSWNGLGDRLSLRPILLIRYAKDRAAAEGWVPYLVADGLLRAIREGATEGRGNGVDNFSWASVRGSIFSGWMMGVPDELEASALATLFWLDATAPVGWRPDSTDDPLIREAASKMMAGSW